VLSYKLAFASDSKDDFVVAANVNTDNDSKTFVAYLMYYETADVLSWCV
jgi:hypothetical protein